MTTIRAWPVRAMYILIAAALAIGLFITAAPARSVSAADDEVVSEWDRVPTPTVRDAVLAPNSTIIDYALGDGGDVAYAIFNSTAMSPENWKGGPSYLAKSVNGAATWGSITEALEKVRKSETITTLVRVATDWVDADFVAVALVENSTLRVYVSKDGGAIFKDANEVKDSVYFATAADVSDLAVSLKGAEGERDVAISGKDNAGNAALFRCTVEGDRAGTWEDATDTTDYPGWDAGASGPLGSIWVTDIIFSPSWEEDRTMLAVTIAPSTSPYTVHLQSGTWGEEGGAWNTNAGFAAAVPVKANVSLPLFLASRDARGIAGVALPSNYDGTGVNTRFAWVWVNYYDPNPPGGPVGEIFLVKKNEAIGKLLGYQIDGNPWLTNVSYWGTITEGKAIAGVLGDGDGGYVDCCTGVQVYRYVNVKNMDLCCPSWEEACVTKLPTGRAAMAVSYVSADKAYAVALQGVYDGQLRADEPYDEGAWSVSFDDGYIWNQLSLIDTYIDYLSDVAVSPDCNKTFLVSVNLHKVCVDYSGCDSVWVHADEFPEAGYDQYSGHWLRTFCFRLMGDNEQEFGPIWLPSERGLLRLAPEEDDGQTVYLVDRMTSTIYYNDMETLNCWETRSTAPRITAIVDLAVKDAGTLYALGFTGYVSMSNDHGKTITWIKEVESKVKNGWTIAAHGAGNATRILVGGDEGEVSYSSDAAKTFTKLEDISTIDGLVTVAFDSYFDTNKVVYAATALADKTGVYRWVIDESKKWKDLGANHDYDYTGLVLGFKDGNPKSSASTGGVLYASYVGCLTYQNPGYYSSNDCYYILDWFDCWKGAGKYWETGVARTLTPAGPIECEKCVEWDYLTVGLTGDDDLPYEYFLMVPQALKICGCTDPTTSTKLFAIGWDDEGDGWWYDMAKAKWGTVWTFEDCYAKKAPALLGPATNQTIEADCFCSNLPFALKWDAVCDACYYDVQIALDDQFTDLVVSTEALDLDILHYEEGGKDILGATGLSYIVPSILTCEVTYYWRVRAHQAKTCQVIHSWWSPARSFTIGPSAEQGKITLLAPEPGALDQPTKNVGFSWDLTATADKYDWKLSKTSDFSGTLVDSKTLTTKSCTYAAGTLDYATTYYWQVKAYNGATLISTSAVGIFTTVAKGPFCCPLDGLCFATEQALKDHNAAEHPPLPGTPFWVWVVIAIGAVLVIVVIVLIFRTRRV